MLDNEPLSRIIARATGSSGGIGGPRIARNSTNFCNTFLFEVGRDSTISFINSNFGVNSSIPVEESVKTKK